MKRSRIHWILFAAFGILLIGAVVLTGGMYFRQERNDRSGTPSLNDSAYNGTDPSTFDSYAQLAILYLNFDPTGTGLQVEMSLTPGGSLTSTSGFNLGASQNVCMISTLNAFNANFDANQLTKTITTSIGLDGDINQYPFDVYTTELEILVTSGPNCTKAPEDSDPVPISPFVFGSVQGFTISAEVAPLVLDPDSDTQATNFNLVSFKFTAKRTDASRAFAVLIFLVMWLLTISLFITTAWYWISGRRVDLPIVALGTALLFALPNIRGAQPGILPRAGIIADMVGYIWNLLIVSGCVISLMVNWIYRKDGKVKKDVSKV